MRRPIGRILIVDDDRIFIDTYRDILTRDGYEIETATTRKDALTRLDKTEHEEQDDRWDLVLIDLKLLGPGGPSQGIELVHDVAARAPGAKTIMVSAFTDKDAIEQAYAAGVHGFLEKQSRVFEHHLRALVRSALEPIREREFGRLDRDAAELEQTIRTRWQALPGETDSHRKGRLLEELVALLFRSIAGFEQVFLHRRSDDEEIDLVIRNESTDLFWAKESPILLVECKNWSKPVGPNEFDRFRNKIQRRSGRAKLGFFIAAAGFTSGFHNHVATLRESDVLILCIGPDKLSQLVESDERNQLLKEIYEQALIPA